MLKVQQKDNKVWLDLDPFYPPKHRHPNTVFKSFAIALRAIGADITYEILMGISGAAFRIQLHEEWCPSSPHPDCGFNCTSVAIKSLNLNAISQAYGYRKDRNDLILNEIISSINKGIPIIACSYETGIVIGYIKRDKEVLLLYREPYSNKGDKPEALKIIPAKYTIFQSIPQRPDFQSFINSLQNAVQLAEISIIDKYHVGFAGYGKWISELTDDSKIKKLRKIGEPELSNQNAHIFYSLLDARQCATKYLGYIDEISNDKTNTHLINAIEYYKQVVRILERGMEFIVWEWEFAKGVKWTEKMRKAQADILRQALTLELKGINEIKDYLAVKRL